MLHKTVLAEGLTAAGAAPDGELVRVMMAVRAPWERPFKAFTAQSAQHQFA